MIMRNWCFFKRLSMMTGMMAGMVAALGAMASCGGNRDPIQTIDGDLDTWHTDHALDGSFDRHLSTYWRVIGSFAQGQADGMWQWFDVQNQLRIIGNTQSNRREGWWYWYDQLGASEQVGYFDRDRPAGMWLIDSFAGNFQGHFASGRQVGWWSHHKDESTQWQGFIHQGQPIGWWFDESHGWRLVGQGRLAGEGKRPMMQM